MRELECCVWASDKHRVLPRRSACEPSAISHWLAMSLGIPKCSSYRSWWPFLLLAVLTSMSSRNVANPVVNHRYHPSSQQSFRQKTVASASAFSLLKKSSGQWPMYLSWCEWLLFASKKVVEWGCWDSLACPLLLLMFNISSVMVFVLMFNISSLTLFLMCFSCRDSGAKLMLKWYIPKPSAPSALRET